MWSKLALFLWITGLRGHLLRIFLNSADERICAAAHIRSSATQTPSPWRCSTSGVRHATGPGCQGQTAMAASMSVWGRHPMPRLSPAPEPVPCRSPQHSADLAFHNVYFRGHWLYDGLFSAPLAPFPTRKDTPHVSHEGRHCGPHVA